METKPAFVGDGQREPFTKLVKCGWPGCGHGLFGTLTIRPGERPTWRLAERLGSVWIEDERGVFRLAHEPKHVYGDGKAKVARTRFKDVSAYEWTANQAEVRHGAISEPGKHPPLIWDWAMECPRCKRVSIVNLRQWYEPHTPQQ